MRLSVIGLGKLGAPMAACFAASGFEVIGVDKDVSKVEMINRGQAPVYEPGLAELLTICGDRLKATTDLKTAVASSEVTFVIVPTPSEPDGSFSLRYVVQACEGIGKALRRKQTWHLVVITSTVSPLSMDQTIRPCLELYSHKRCGSDFGLCYGPEFIALGSVIRDLLYPDFVLIGESDPKAGETLADIYRHLCKNDPPVARMNFVNAELTKLAVNTFVTTKISFANMLARICERLPGANVDVVTAALGLDSRIGPRYLKGAIGYGGPCFPRDNLALVALGRSIGVPAALAEVTDAFNRKQVQWLAALVKKYLPSKGRVAILGLAYKPNSDVVEESQGLLLTQQLIREGINVIAYDPVARNNAQHVLDGTLTLATNLSECIMQADVIVITTPWEEFKSIHTFCFEKDNAPRVIIDCWRYLNLEDIKKNFVYIPLGINEEI
ncbi:MAG: UDP-glucose/GDP-mannose dehydrogenase family protein [Bacteroidetes bacterium]|nr:UDP-glucose/GDP-mannose dehydrogenase family protein [Rhodothermia bacterium]MCX7906598.1 UDP-glucose/GDP-mannose dehydrogenase family protein [Bacteroidota bacterium]MDW8285009.1 UDP-glucose/GDP-mannose dehydrogenase family protein [Bacteroidota bacterium]